MKNFVSNSFVSTSSTSSYCGQETFVREDFKDSQPIIAEMMNINSTTSVLPQQLLPPSTQIFSSSSDTINKVDHEHPTSIIINNNYIDEDFEDESDSEDENDELYHEPDQIELASDRSSTSTSSVIKTSILPNDQTVDSDTSRSSTPPSNMEDQIRSLDAEDEPSEKAKAKRRRRRGKRKTKAQKEALALAREAGESTVSSDPTSGSSLTTPSTSPPKINRQQQQQKSPSKKDNSNTPSDNNKQQKKQQQRNQKNSSTSSNTQQLQKNKKTPQKQLKFNSESSLLGKSDVVAPPRRFSHSALRLRDSDESIMDSSSISLIKPIRQPLGPSIGNNGFSVDYQKSRRLAIQRSKLSSSN